MHAGTVTWQDNRSDRYQDMRIALRSHHGMRRHVRRLSLVTWHSMLWKADQMLWVSDAQWSCLMQLSSLGHRNVQGVSFKEQLHSLDNTLCVKRISAFDIYGSFMKYHLLIVTPTSRFCQHAMPVYHAHPLILIPDACATYLLRNIRRAQGTCLTPHVSVCQTICNRRYPDAQLW